MPILSRFPLLALSVLATAVGCSDGSPADPPAEDSGAMDTGALPDTGESDTPTDTGAPADTSVEDTPTDAGKGTDLGFRPKPDGFGFENYGTGAPVTNLTAADMKRLFGGAACVSPTAATCVLTPPAAEWMDRQNAGMGGGHCEGMAALSLLFYTGKQSVTDFGSVSATHDLSLSGNEKLQREIAYWFVTQATEPTAGGEIRTLTPVEVVDKLQEGLAKGAPETFTMGIYQRGPKAGHAITPYKVDLTASPIKVFVYDNNFPGEERVLEVDKDKNTWRYFASTSPSVPGSEYEGDATTKTLTLTPTSNRLKPQDCPFCGEVKADGSVKGSTFSYRQITLNGKANLLVSDDATGKKLGFQAGALVSEIAGARYVTPKSKDLWNDDQEPMYLLPFGTDLTVTLDGSLLGSVESSTVTMVAPGVIFEVDEVMLDAGQKDTIKLSKDNLRMVYKTVAKESPVLYAGVTVDGDADWFFAIKGYGETAGQEISLQFDLVKKRLVIKLLGADVSADFDIIAVRSDDTGSQTFTHSGNGAKPTDTMYLDYGAWSGDGTPMKLEIDTNGDGTPDMSIDLTDT